MIRWESVFVTQLYSFKTYVTPVARVTHTCCSLRHRRDIMLGILRMLKAPMVEDINGTDR